jgi:hypothetical protein
MDAAHLMQLFALIGIAIGIGWFVLTSLGQAGDAVSGALSAVGPGAPPPARRTTRSWWETPRPLAIDAANATFVEIDLGFAADAQTVPRRGRFVVPPIRVAPIRLRVLAT